VSAEGSFGLNFTKDSKLRLGETFRPSFRVFQDVRDLLVLKRILVVIGCGYIVNPSGDRSVYSLNEGNLNNLINYIVPFFSTYTLHGAKYLDFNDWKKGLELISNKGHLTEKGLTELKGLAYSMNSFRTNFNEDEI